MTFVFPGRVYPIVGDSSDAHTPTDLCEAVLAGGAKIVQLRLKRAPTGSIVETARRLKRRCDAHGAMLIVNDRTDIAKLVDAAGVHLGQDDLPVGEARKILGTNAIIGTSTHNLAQVQQAQRERIADYIAYGPVFATQTKVNPDPVQGLDALRQARAACAKPLVAIGGIDASNIASVFEAGADCAAVISAVSASPDPGTALAELSRVAGG